MPDSDGGAARQLTTGDVLVARLADLSQRFRNRPLRSARPVDWTTGDGVALLERELGRSGVPALYREATWDRFPQRDLVDPYVDAMPGCIKDGKGLVIMGPLGTGKSSVAGLVVRQALMVGATCRWSYLPDLLGALDDKFKREQIIKLEVAPDLLVWDDFNVARMSEWQVGYLDRITENRYRQHKAMIITTNATPEGLRSFVEGSRMIDRWRQRNSGIKIVGESLRETWKDR